MVRGEKKNTKNSQAVGIIKTELCNEGCSQSINKGEHWSLTRIKDSHLTQILAVQTFISQQLVTFYEHEYISNSTMKSE